MSHSVVCVILPRGTPNSKIGRKVAALLAPYDENKEVEPYKKYPKKDEIETMAEHYKLKPTNLEGLAKRMEGWSGHKGGVDKKGLFYVTTYNPDSKWDWWRVGGRWDGAIVGDYESSEGGFNFGAQHEGVVHNSCLVRDIAKDFVPFAIVTPEGEWVERGRMGWWGMVAGEKSGKEWGKAVRAIFKKYPSHTIVAVDCHI